MKKLNTKNAAITAAAVATVVGVTGLGIATVHAQSTDGEYPLIVEKLAATFNVKEFEVEQVFRDTREEQETLRLTQAVEDGEIKESQIDEILAKREELQSSIEEINNKSLTSDERREQIRAFMDAQQTWAEDNDIPVRLLMAGGRRGPDTGPREGGMGMMK